MSHSSLYLTKLYNDLITNTPQTITMDIPSEVGQGQFSQTKIKHGVIISDCEFAFQTLSDFVSTKTLPFVLDSMMLGEK